ncbi:very short patch repair endonuclease [Flavobacterium filum]|uniref:very short patch repair endonuclease n=1 Tax=Flavobacterium filum TaxID=370974 RepID=UPI0023F254CD|nr:very short patch repair endonuclease [Flavobacterium filum]
MTTNSYKEIYIYKIRIQNFYFLLYKSGKIEMPKLTKDQRRKNMQANKSSGTKIETALARELWSLGFRYRKNDKTVFGKPDIVFKKYKIAVFIDGEFWHGKDWETRKHDHKSNQEFWHKKIERNIERDKEVNEQLLKEGWKVFRFWGQDITKNLRNCTDKITSAINESKREDQH